MTLLTEESEMQLIPSSAITGEKGLLSSDTAPRLVQLQQLQENTLCFWNT